MEQVIDRSHASSSPEELAIHFLLRHAECRSALTGSRGEDRPYDASAPPGPNVPATHPVPVDSRRSEESRPSKSAAEARVTKDDSCTARYLRAYAAARHIRVEIEVAPPARAATSAGTAAESNPKEVCQKA